MATQPISSEIEEWRDVPGWENVYRVSSHGRVMRLPRVVISKCGVSRFFPTHVSFGGRIGNYKGVTLSANGRLEKFSVHVLVCSVFHGKKPRSSPQVRHLDGNPHNNRADNLAWGTSAENAKDRRAHGTQQIGETVKISKLTEGDVRRIRRDHVPGYGGLTALARRYSVSPTQILNIVRRKQWTHI